VRSGTKPWLVKAARSGFPGQWPRLVFWQRRADGRERGGAGRVGLPTYRSADGSCGRRTCSC